MANGYVNGITTSEPVSYLTSNIFFNLFTFSTGNIAGQYREILK